MGTPPLTIAITTYNRDPQMVIDSFRQVYDHPAVDEVVIVDDCSDNSQFIQLDLDIETFRKGKPAQNLSVYRNTKNMGMSRNKSNAIRWSRNDWVLILDSDNALYPSSIDAICKLTNLRTDTIYCPAFAEPEFDYRRLQGKSWDAKGVASQIKSRDMSVLLNTCNYLVHRDTYLETYEYNPDVKESDTIWFNYLWLRRGGLLHVVPDWHYYHRIHEGSGWKQNASENMRMAERIKGEIVQLANQIQ